MPGNGLIELWLDRRKLDAAEQSLRDRGTSVEKRMEELFQTLYAEAVPLPVQEEIERQIQEEKARMTLEAASQVKQTAYRITRNERQGIFRSGIGSDFLMTAIQLKRYISDPARDFEALLPEREPIPAEEFDALAMRRLEDAPQVVGVFDLDFNRLELSCVDSEAGWQTFPMASVLSSLDRVERKQGLSHEQNRTLLMKNLEGWAVPSPGHLSMDAIAFDGEIGVLPGRLVFQLDPEAWFDSLDAVFGTDTCTKDNNDFLDVRAGYDLAKREVCGDLEVTVCRNLESPEVRRYPLGAVEKACVNRRMEEYCQRQTGMTLTGYSAAIRQSGAMPHTEPLTDFDLMTLYAEMCVAEMAEKILADPHYIGQPPEEALPDHGMKDGLEPEEYGTEPVMGGM